MCWLQTLHARPLVHRFSPATDLREARGHLNAPELRKTVGRAQRAVGNTGAAAAKELMLLEPPIEDCEDVGDTTNGVFRHFGAGRST